MKEVTSAKCGFVLKSKYCFSYFLTVWFLLLLFFFFFNFIVIQYLYSMYSIMQYYSWLRWDSFEYFMHTCKTLVQEFPNLGIWPAIKNKICKSEVMRWLMVQEGRENCSEKSTDRSIFSFWTSDFFCEIFNNYWKANKWEVWKGKCNFDGTANNAKTSEKYQGAMIYFFRDNPPKVKCLVTSGCALYCILWAIQKWTSKESCTGCVVSYH